MQKAINFGKYKYVFQENMWTCTNNFQKCIMEQG